MYPYVEGPLICAVPLPPIIRGSNNNGRDSYVCDSCHTHLPRLSMPHLALANKLHLGRLPEEFYNLTWIGERVCAIYTDAALVIRL